MIPGRPLRCKQKNLAIIQGTPGHLEAAAATEAAAAATEAAEAAEAAQGVLGFVHVPQKLLKLQHRSYRHRTRARRGR